MSVIIDERGRVLGRINLLDAAAAVFLFVLIPVAYGAYLLFRTPPAKLTSISPNKLYAGPNQHVRIEGVNLRPFLRVAFGGTQGLTFAIVSTTSADVEVPELAPGSYDVVLFDFKQEIDRLPKGLTVMNAAPVPTVEMEVTGSFKGLNTTTAGQFKPGQALAQGRQQVEVLRVGALRPSVFRVTAGTSVLAMQVAGQVELPAALRLNCYTDVAPDGSVRCMRQGPVRTEPIAPDSLLTLPGADGWVSFQIDTVGLPAPPAMLTVRAAFNVRAEIAAIVRAGDADSNAVAYATPATVVAVNGSRAISTTDAAIDVTLRVPAVHASSGWVYNRQVIKAGLPIRFESANYVIDGQMVKVDAPLENRQ